MFNRAKKILVLYISVGLGHKSLAENIGFWLEEQGYEVRLVDVLEAQKDNLGEVSVKIHLFINRHLPWVWRWLYNSTNTGLLSKFTLGLRTKLAGKHHQKFLNVLLGFNPDVVISTHATPSAVMAYLKQKNLYTGPLGIAFCDYHLHRYWLYHEADFYLANLEGQKQQMVVLGIDPNKIFVCGIILKPKKEFDAKAIKLKLGIPQSNKVVMIACGSLGIGLNESVIKQAASLNNVSVIVLCGKNLKMQEYLSNKYRNTNVLIFGYYVPLGELFAITDFFLSKPGGMSIAEALRWKISILIFYMLPGQEELNYKYLKDTGLVMPGSNDLANQIKLEIESHNFHKSLLSNGELDRLVPGPGRLIEAVAKFAESKLKP